MAVGAVCPDCGCPLTGNESHAPYDDDGLCSDCFRSATDPGRRCPDCGGPIGSNPRRVHRDGEEVCSDCFWQSSSAR